jgi:hypothetical protein
VYKNPNDHYFKVIHKNPEGSFTNDRVLNFPEPVFRAVTDYIELII